MPTLQTGIQTPVAEVDHAELDADGEENTVVEATGAVYTAYDPDMGSVNYALMGTDGNLFTLNASQMLRFKTAPDHENPMDRNGDNVYEVTVRATDGTMHADLMVEVTVTDVNEDPMIAELDGTIEYAEDRTDPVATFTATDPEDDTVTWTVGGDRRARLRHQRGRRAHLRRRGRRRARRQRVARLREPRGQRHRQRQLRSYGNGNIVRWRTDGENTDMEDVTVEVTDVAEDGEVTWTVAVGDHTEVLQAIRY